MGAEIVLNPQTTIANQSATNYTVNGDSGVLDANGFHYLLAGFTTGTISGGTSNVSMSLEMLAPDGSWVGLNSVTVSPNGVYVTKVGPGLGAGSDGGVESIFGNTVRIRWILGSEVTTANFSYWLIGQS